MRAGAIIAVVPVDAYQRQSDDGAVGRQMLRASGILYLFSSTLLLPRRGWRGTSCQSAFGHNPL